MCVEHTCSLSMITCCCFFFLTVFTLQLKSLINLSADNVVPRGNSLAFQMVTLRVERRISNYDVLLTSPRPHKNKEITSDVTDGSLAPAATDPAGAWGRAAALCVKEGSKISSAHQGFLRSPGLCLRGHVVHVRRRFGAAQRTFISQVMDKGALRGSRTWPCVCLVTVWIELWTLLRNPWCADDISARFPASGHYSTQHCYSHFQEHVHG